MSNYHHAAKRIRKARRALGLTQQDLSRVSGVSVAEISRIENGQRFGAVRAERLAKALGMPRSRLWRDKR